MATATKIGVALSVCAALVTAGVAWYVFAPPAEPVQVRARRAYEAKHYKEALPLFEAWAAQPGVSNTPERLREPMAYIMDIKARLNPPDPGALNAAPFNAKADAAPASSEQLVMQAQARAAAEAAALGTEPQARVPHQPVKPGEVRAMTIKALGNFPFNWETDTTVPADVMALDGARVRLNGYMLPLTQADKITKFALVPSLVGCCFGQPPGVEHVITCTVPIERASDFMTDELVVEGTLHVRIQRQEGITNSIFEMDVGEIQLKE